MTDRDHETGEQESFAAVSSPAEDGPAESGPAESGPAESGPAESGPGVSGPAESGPGVSGAAESGNAERAIDPTEPVPDGSPLPAPVIPAVIPAVASESPAVAPGSPARSAFARTAFIPSDDDTLEREPRERMTARRLLAIGGRGAGTAVAVLIAVVAVGGSTLAQDPRWTIDPSSTVVTPVPAAQQRVCPGPLLRLGDETGQGATSASSVGAAASVFQALPDEVGASPLPSTENTEGVAPLLLTLPPQDDASADPQLAGSQSQFVDVDDLVGFAAAECVEPSGDSWLVGGAADVGRTTLITISNPTTVIATVDLTIYSEAGIVPAPGAEGIAVPPGAQRIFSLAGFAPGVVRPVVHVESRGGQVVSSLQQSVVRTLAPGGADIVAPGVGPVTRAVIPGLTISQSEAVIAAQSGLGYEDLGTVLRLLAPGDEEVGVSVTITPESAALNATPVQATTLEVTVRPGEVDDVPLAGLADGVYTVTVVASGPIAAGVRSSVLTSGAASDLVWLSTAPELAASSLVSVAAGPGPALRLANDTDAPISATVVGSGVGAGVDAGASGAEPGGAGSGGAVEVLVPARGSVGIAVAPRSDLQIDATAGLRAAVTYLGSSGASAFSVTPPGPASTPVRVYR